MPAVCSNRPKESLTVCRAESKKSQVSPMSMICNFARPEWGFSPRLSPRQRRSKISLSQSEKSRLCTYHQSAVASHLLKREQSLTSPTSDGVSETFTFPSQRAAQKGLNWQHLSTPACSTTELCKHLENNSLYLGSKHLSANTKLSSAVVEAFEDAWFSGLCGVNSED